MKFKTKLGLLAGGLIISCFSFVVVGVQKEVVKEAFEKVRQTKMVEWHEYWHTGAYDDSVFTTLAKVKEFRTFVNVPVSDSDILVIHSVTDIYVVMDSICHQLGVK